MANNQFNLSFVTDLDRGITLTPLRQAFMEDDHQAHVFIVKAVRGGAAVSLAGAAVTGYFIPYGMETAVQLPGSVDANGAASVSLTRDCYAFLGRFNLVIQTTIDGVDSSIFYGEGYVTRTRTDTVIEPSGAVPSLAALEAKINALDAAKAPAGYGLGERLVGLDTQAEVDAFVFGGAKRYYNTDYTSLVPGMPEGHDVTIVNLGADPYFLQLAISREGTIVAVRHFRAGVYGEWEWVNPPMVSGVEYRTTERWAGKAVYVKLVYLASAGIGMTITQHGISMTQCIECKGCESANDTFPTKYNDSGVDVTKNIYANSTQILVYSTVAMNHIHCILKYTKD